MLKKHIALWATCYNPHWCAIRLWERLHLWNGSIHLPYISLSTKCNNPMLVVLVVLHVSISSCSSTKLVNLQVEKWSFTPWLNQPGAPSLFILSILYIFHPAFSLYWVSVTISRCNESIYNQFYEQFLCEIPWLKFLYIFTYRFISAPFRLNELPH